MLVLERLFLAAFVLAAHIRPLSAAKRHGAEHHQDMCRQIGIGPDPGKPALGAPL
jgi:hypothetical protein